MEMCGWKGPPWSFSTPGALRAFFLSEWLHGVLSLTQCCGCHPPPWGAAGCLFLWVLHPSTSFEQLGSSGLPQPSWLWGVPWAPEGGGWWGPGWDMAEAETAGVTVAKFFFFFEKFALCCEIAPLPA